MAATSLTLLSVPAAHADSEATLTITPDQLSGPCDGVQFVQFAAAGFLPSKGLVFRFRTANGKKVGVISTDPAGDGTETFKFNTAKIPPGAYTFWAVQTKGPSASAVFTETVCD